MPDYIRCRMQNLENDVFHVVYPCLFRGYDSGPAAYTRAHEIAKQVRIDCEEFIKDSGPQEPSPPTDPTR